jgi:hypothetical protein
MTGNPLDCRSYIQSVRQLYLSLPHTPNRFSRTDRQLAAELHRDNVPLSLIRAALLLATARRIARDPSKAPLLLIRSLHYFLPAIDEVRTNPLPASYVQYLESKIRAAAHTGAR